MEAKSQEVATYAVKIKSLLDAPDTMDRIFLHIANGGDLISFCQNLEIRYSDIAEWISSSISRAERYGKACKMAEEWIRNRILNEIGRIALIDIRDIFRPDGTMIPVDLWPEDIARAVSSLEVEELWSGGGEIRMEIGKTKKLKLTDKLKALELLGKQMGMFVQHHKHEGKLTLEELVAGSREKPAE